MAQFRKGPPGKRGIGFGGFNLKSSEEPEQLQKSAEFSKHSDRSPPRRSKPEEPKKLTKLSEEDYEEIRQFEESKRRRRRSRSRSPRRRRSRSPRRRSRSRSPRRRSRSPQSPPPRRRSRSPARRRSPSPKQTEPSAAVNTSYPEPPQKRSFQEPEKRSFQEFPASKTGERDELLEYAEEQLEDEDSDDPLDAFMAGIETEIKKQEIKKKEKVEEEAPEKGLRCDIDEEDDQESYFKAMEENPNFVPPDEEDDLEVEYDEDGNPVYTPKKKVIEPLPSLDHSEIKYEAFGKDFYTEHSEISKLNTLQVIQLRNALGIRVSGHNAPKPVASFAHFGFDPQTMVTIRKQEYTKPTPIQAQAIPAAMSGRDVIGIARTGSGKTAAYVWPMIPHIMDQEELRPAEGPIALVLAPTRELCIQIHQECRRFCKAFKLRVVCAYGGGNMHEQERALMQQCEIVVATPGRLIDHIKRKKCPMTRVTYLVLDECDRMFDLGFEPQVNSIVNQCRPDRQILLFSATMRNKITRLCRKILESPIHVQEQHGAGSANQDVTQITYTFKHQDEKYRWLTSRLVEFSSNGSVLIFVTRKVNSEEMAAKLRRSDYELGLLHGDMSQFERNDILSSFKRQDFRILVATDVAARGLDIKEIKTVINYDVSRDIDTHTHRVGRTGRAGEKGTAYTLLTNSDWRFCGDLVKHLEMACQEVPEDLVSIAMKDPNFKKGRGNPRKGFGRGDQKMRPGLGSESPAAPPQAITSGPMSARQQFGGLNALGGSGTRATEIKTAMKSNYMSRFSKASPTSQKGFLPEQKGFAKPSNPSKPSNPLYAGFTKASDPSPRAALPLVTPAKAPKSVPLITQPRNVPLITPPRNVPLITPPRNVPLITPPRNVPLITPPRNIPLITPPRNVPLITPPRNVPLITPPRNQDSFVVPPPRAPPPTKEKKRRWDS